MARIEVESEVTGNVWKVEVEVGAVVAEGDVLIIIESMKIEHAITAPVAGKVTRLAVAEGDQVAARAPLVEIDPDTGAVRIVAYSVAHDFGRTLNPLMLAGQVHGGIAQGLGQAGFEHVVYDESGQLLSGSLLDYCLPRADDMPEFYLATNEVLTEQNSFGVKGCGEAGCIPSVPAVVNAVVDGLAPLGINHLDMPLTAERVWRAINGANSKTGASDD